jgi:hypothetical protein
LSKWRTAERALKMSKRVLLEGMDGRVDLGKNDAPLKTEWLHAIHRIFIEWKSIPKNTVKSALSILSASVCLISHIPYAFYKFQKNTNSDQTKVFLFLY